MISLLKNEKGVALVLTLAIVAILTAAAFQLGKFTGDSVQVTSMDKDRFQADQIAISGINLALLILTDDAEKNSIDSVQEMWADPDKLSQAINELGFNKHMLSIKITDELSKIQANALIEQFPGNQLNPDQSRLWENFFALQFLNNIDLDKKDPITIINAAKDWIDSNDDDAISGLSGAESEYYQTLDPPYECGNGPFNHIDELVSVKGISRDLLKQDPSGQNRKAPEGRELDEVFTVFGLDDRKSDAGGFRYPGRININTADVDVLAALLPVGFQDLAQDLADFREQKGEKGEIFLNLLDKGWYKEVIELSKKEQTQFDRLIRYDSDTFKVECNAKKNAADITLIVFLKRKKNKESGKWTCQILQMERK